MRPLNADKKPAAAEKTAADGLLSGSGGVAARFLRRVVRKARSNFGWRTLITGKVGILSILTITAGSVGYLMMVQSENTPSIASRLMEDAGFSTSSLIVNGTSAVEQKGIKLALGPQLQSSIFSFDTGRAQETLLENPWLKSASVQKVYPNTVVVDIVERQPFAFWKASDFVTVIARDGVVLGEASPEHLKLPQVVGQGANLAASEFISVISRFPAIVERTNAFVRVADRRWNLVMREGPKVMLPENDWKNALIELDKLQRARGILDRELVQIDMRLPDRYVFRLEEESAAERREHREKLLKRSWHRT
ncbi:MAG: cell division protein FtsQ/DivIB [Rhizobiaceae bacterium]